MHRRTLMATLVATCISLTPIGRAAAPPDGDAVAALMARIEGRQVPDRQGFDGLTLAQLMERFRVPGVSVAVIKDHEIDWAKGYGIADVTAGAPVTTDTIFQAASISKPAAAMGVLRLVQDGRLSLDADVNTFLKSWKLRSRRVHTRTAGDASRTSQPHLRTRRWVRLPRLSPEGSGAVGRADPQWRKTVEYRQGPVGTAAFQRVQILRWRRHRRAARGDRHYRACLSRIDEDLVLDPIGMKNSGFD